MKIDWDKIDKKSFIGFCIKEQTDFMVIATAIVDGYIETPKTILKSIGIENVISAHKYFLENKINFYESYIMDVSLCKKQGK